MNKNNNITRLNKIREANRSQRHEYIKAIIKDHRTRKARRIRDYLLTDYQIDVTIKTVKNDLRYLAKINKKIKTNNTTKTTKPNKPCKSCGKTVDITKYWERYKQSKTGHGLSSLQRKYFRGD